MASTPLAQDPLRSHWEQGSYESVAQELLQQLEQGSQHPLLYWWLGAAYLLLGRELEAQLTWQEGVALLMGKGLGEPEASRCWAKGLQELAEGLWERGHWPQAAALYRQLVEGSLPADLEPVQALAAHRLGRVQELSLIHI